LAEIQEIRRMQRLRPPVRAPALLAIIAIWACASATQQSGPGGGASRVAPVEADSARAAYAAGDVRFMSGMIHHHAQAVLMAGWAPTHGASQAVRAMCERIVVGQRDEIVLLERWLRERHEAVPVVDTSHNLMPGMDHSMIMPGMLTPSSWRSWTAPGADFDRLFLRFMIQHHQGAVTMVDQLFGSQGAGEKKPSSDRLRHLRRPDHRNRPHANDARRPRVRRGPMTTASHRIRPRVLVP
jgi:uncharacterized protein (DUF305 family)